MRHRLAVPLALAVAGLIAPAAQAAPPNPFGHVCAPQSGVLFCPTMTDAERVPSFDGVPLDVDVTLPANGDGPFPTIVMLHGYGGDKGSFEKPTSVDRYNNRFFAQQGYAVVNYSARGFGRSCGRPDSRTSPGCDAGWLHLADHRYEARDTQHLLGLLVDQGVAKADALGVTGVSYGGIQSLNLARLRNRVRLPDGSFQRWTSPNGTPLQIAAAYPRWAASDLTYALQPNGRFLDFRTPKPNQSIRPGGVMKKSYNDGLYLLGALSGFYAPKGSAFNADLTTWKERADRGEPARADALAVGRELTGFHSWAGLSGPSAPLLVQNGWTDDLFPAPEALRVYRTFTAAPGARISLQLGDLGHPRGSNRLGVVRSLLGEGRDFFDAYLKGEGKPPPHGSVVAYTQSCPGVDAGRRRFEAENWERLRVRTVTMRRARCAADELPRRQSCHGAGDRPDCYRGSVPHAPGRAGDGHGDHPAALPAPLHDARHADGPGGDQDQRARWLHRRAAVGRAPRQAAAGFARGLQAEGQPARQAALPALRERMALCSRPHREAGAARQ